MNWYDINLKALKMGNKALYDKISCLPTGKGEVRYSLDCSLTETREAEKALCVTREGVSFRMNSAVRPIAEAKRWAVQYQSNTNIGIISMFGMGSGLFLRNLREQMGKDARLLLLEPSVSLFLYMIEHLDFTWLFADQKIQLILEELEPLAFREALIKYVDYYTLPSQLVCCHPQYDKLFPESCSDFFRTLTENDERVMVNKNTLSRFSSLIVENTLKNLSILKELHSAAQLSDIVSKGLPAIIVSAGPSLDRNIEFLRDAKGKALIICVDTAIKYMLEKDILPDLTIAIEPEKPVFHYADQRSHEIPLICDIELNPEIVALHRGRKVLYNCRGFLNNLLKPLGKASGDIGSGGSVATAAFALCYQLGLEHIILVGQDLAYTGEATHAGGVESLGINHEIGKEFVEDIYGGKVRTRGDWLAYLHWFERSIQVIKDKNQQIEVIDATEGGARIKGTKLMPLSEAVNAFCTQSYDFSNQLSHLDPMLTAGEFTFVESLIKKSRDELFVVRDQAAEAVLLCDQALAGVKAAGEKVEQIKAYCENAIAYPLLNDYAVTKIADELQSLSQNMSGIHQKKENYYKKLRLAFAAMPDACDAMIALFDTYCPGT